MNAIETKTYDFPEGTLVKYFDTKYGVTINYYTVIKNGKESKHYSTVGYAMKALNK